MEAIVVTIIKISRLTGNGERDGGRHAAKVAQLGSRTGNAARALQPNKCTGIGNPSGTPQTIPFMLSAKQGGIGSHF